MPTVAKPPKSLRVRRPLAGAGPLLTSEEFLGWLEPGARADLIAGTIHMHSPVNILHARLTNFLDHLIRDFLDETNTPGELHRESVAVRLTARETFMPDLSFFTAHQVSQFAEAHVPVAPMFCVEVLSPSSVKRDLGPKFAAYEQHGVQEYWVLDPAGGAHRFFRRAGDIFEEFAVGAERIESSTLAPFWLRRAWLDAETPPKVSTCLREIVRRRR
jgi:Uma2 family endonuclease